MGSLLVVAVVCGAVTVAVAAALGRVQARSSCAVADPRRDLRMRATYDEGNEGRPDASRTA